MTSREFALEPLPDLTPGEEESPPSSSPSSPGDDLPANPEYAGGKHPVGAAGINVLRAGMGALGLDKFYGNRLAEWLNQQDWVEVRIWGREPEPPLVVYGTPDVDVPVKRGMPFRPGMSRDELEITEGVE